MKKKENTEKITLFFYNGKKREFNAVDYSDLDFEEKQISIQCLGKEYVIPTKDIKEIQRICKED